MTPEPSEQQRRRQLLIELVDGESGQEQLVELQQWMNSDPDRVEEVVDHLLLDSLLQEARGADAVASLVDMVADSEAMPVGPTITPTSTLVASPQSSDTKIHAQSDWRRGVSWIPSRVGWPIAFVAGCVVASLVVSSNRVPNGPHEDGHANAKRPVAERSNESQPAPTIAALLVDEVGAKFADGRGPNGVRFGPGEYELLEGIVHLRFAQGADMVLSSPARLEVTDSQHTRLAFGKVRVIAPPTAKGFTIATRAADYVDLGTEFGLRVDSQSGASDLYVFDGQVNVTDSRSGKVLSEVVEGKSSRFVGGVSETAPKLTDDEFPTPGAIGFERWREYERTLRRDRDLLALFPFERTADEAALVNRSAATASDGRIVGARWTSGRWPGKAALLFDRDDDCVQIEVLGEHQELTIAAWLKIERLDFELNAILNSDGKEKGGVHFQLTRQGLPRGGILDGRGYRETVVGKGVPVGRWAHVASVLSVPNRSQRIYVNGVLVRERSLRGDEVIRPGKCRLGNWLPAGTLCVNRAFRGRMDELAIWRRALSKEEIQQKVEAGRPGLLFNETETDPSGSTVTNNK